MNQHTTKSFLEQSIQETVSDIRLKGLYVKRPGKDLTRRCKLPPDDLIRYFICSGSFSTRNQIADFFNYDTDRMVTEKGLQHQQDKLLPEGMRSVFTSFTDKLVVAKNDQKPKVGKDAYRFIAVDGTNISFPKYTGPGAERYEKKTRGESHSALHCIAAYDLDHDLYLDMLAQPRKESNEHDAMIQLVRRHRRLPGEKPVFMTDRGFEGYNAVAHILDTGSFAIMRLKDITVNNGMAKALCQGVKEDEFDIDVTVTVTRIVGSKCSGVQGIVKMIPTGKRFDFAEEKTDQIHVMRFRLIRFKHRSEYYCLLTNLPREDFSAEDIRKEYIRRWVIEVAYRKSKCAAGLDNIHSTTPQHVECELFGTLIACNFTLALTHECNQELAETKKSCERRYEADFSSAIHTCRKFLHPYGGNGDMKVMKLICKHIHAVRPGRPSPPRKDRTTRSGFHCNYYAA